MRARERALPALDTPLRTEFRYIYRVVRLFVDRSLVFERGVCRVLRKRGRRYLIAPTVLYHCIKRLFSRVIKRPLRLRRNYILLGNRANIFR